MNRKRVAVVSLAVVAGAAAVLVARGSAGARASEVRLAFARVDRGPVVEGVHATGTVQPRVLVSVGTQVTGVVDRVFKDWNDRVKEGEVVAVLDSRRLVSQVLQDEASLGKAEADLDRARALSEQATKDLARARSLAARRFVAESELDAAVASERSLRAQVAVAAAVVSLSLAQLEGDRVSLRLATIVSPVDGVVVSRNVDPGQTMAAALAAPTLFQIANDLEKVQVQVSVPEADVGRVRLSKRASFRVDAYPERVFEGTFSQLRLAATSISNVVTYTVLVDAENPGERLLPGMTATVTFEIRRDDDALRVPVAALRFEPPAEVAPDALPPGASRVWVRSSGGALRPVTVSVGVSDGIVTAATPVAASDLVEGNEVATAVVEEDEPASAGLLRPPGMGRPRKAGP